MRHQSPVWRADATARQRALRDVADRHPDEFAVLHAARRRELGLSAEMPGSGGPYRLDEGRLRCGWLEGETVAALAAVFDCSPSTVRNHVRRLGLPPRRAGWQNQRRAS